MKKENKTKQSLSDKCLELSEKLDRNKDALIKIQLQVIKKLIVVLVIYALLSAIFLGIYAVAGFEKTLVLLGVSIMFWGIKQNYNNLKRIVVLEQVVRDERERRNDRKTK